MHKNTFTLHTSLLAFLLISTTVFSQNKKFDVDWAKQFEVKTYKPITNLCADNEDNVYTIINYDELKYGNLELTSANKNSAVVIKFNAAGEMLWHYPLHDNATTVKLTDLEVNEAGDVFIYGEYGGELKLSQDIVLDAPEATFQKNTFLAKINSNGKLLWARHFVRGNPSAYLVPSENKSILLHTYELQNRQFADSVYGFNPNYGIALFDSSGNTKATHLVNGFITEWYSTADGKGNYYNLIAFKKDSININNTWYTNTGDKYSYILTALDNNLNVKWVKHWANALSNKYSIGSGKYHLTTDEAGNVYVQNLFTDTFKVEDKEVVSSNIFIKMFFAKVDAEGNLQWLRQSQNPLGYESGRLFGVRNNRLYLIATNSYGSIEFDDLPKVSNNIALLTLDATTGKALSAQNWVLTEGGFYVIGKEAHYAFAGLSERVNYYFKGMHYIPVGQGDKILIKLDSVSTVGFAKEKIAANNFSLYPNPAANSVKVTVKNAADATSLHITITDLTGKSIMQQNATAKTSTTLDVSTLPNGFYFINVRNNKGNTSTQKLLIQR